MRNDEHLFMHFRPEERNVAERALDWASRASRRHCPVLTPFLDPREQFILQSVAGREPDLILQVDGGYPEAERKRAIIMPDWHPEDPGLFGLSFLRMESEAGERLEHPDVLGALSGAGIRREKIGDILPHRTGADVIVAEENGDYIRCQIGQVGRKHVTIMHISREELTLPEQRGMHRTANVASMRLDALVSEGFRVPRSQAALMIRTGRCKVNWAVEHRPDRTLEEGDLISLRGFGRIRVERIDGITRKGRLRVDLFAWR
ncbi:RNA-binding protein [Staphylospora marina]|uniref:YlmH family RNA-binding protein n=1 Tax=Staphylospora marina TaxID=2490858 RepID=UPI000F5BC86A|nr:YlmH/Sll1252 family protein [Staphylospora marina]